MPIQVTRFSPISVKFHSPITSFATHSRQVPSQPTAPCYSTESRAPWSRPPSYSGSCMLRWSAFRRFPAVRATRCTVWPARSAHTGFHPGCFLVCRALLCLERLCLLYVLLKRPSYPVPTTSTQEYASTTSFANHTNWGTQSWQTFHTWLAGFALAAVQSRFWLLWRPSRKTLSVRLVWIIPLFFVRDFLNYCRACDFAPLVVSSAVSFDPNCLLIGWSNLILRLSPFITWQ